MTPPPSHPPLAGGGEEGGGPDGEPIRVLVAEDEPELNRILAANLRHWGYEVTSVANGDDALRVLAEDSPPALAVLDWMMPGTQGIEVCRKMRSRAAAKGIYLILLTSKGGTQAVIEGLAAGAHDYVTKPFALPELRARLAVGERVARLQRALAGRVAELERAVARVDKLEGLLPMCMYCKSIRDDQDYWHEVGEYITRHAGARLTHGICPRCRAGVMGPMSSP